MARTTRQPANTFSGISIGKAHAAQQFTESRVGAHKIEFGGTLQSVNERWVSVTGALINASLQPIQRFVRVPEKAILTRDAN